MGWMPWNLVDATATAHWLAPDKRHEAGCWQRRHVVYIVAHFWMAIAWPKPPVQSHPLGETLRDTLRLTREFDQAANLVEDGQGQSRDRTSSKSVEQSGLVLDPCTPSASVLLCGGWDKAT